MEFTSGPYFPPACPGEVFCALGSRGKLDKILLTELVFVEVFLACPGAAGCVALLGFPRQPNKAALTLAFFKPTFISAHRLSAQAIERVAECVRQGGHSIPESVIRRRFVSGQCNLRKYYCKAVDDWAIYDNSGDNPVLLEWGER